MLRIALVAGTYLPAHCGVAHYTAHLRQALLQRGIVSSVLTTNAAAAVVGDSQEIVGVVDDWNVANLWRLVEAIHAAEIDLLHIQHAAGTYDFDRAIFLLPFLLKLTRWQGAIVTTIHEYGWWEWQPRWFPASWLESLKQWGQDRGWWDREDGFLLTLSDAIITTNNDAKTVLQTRLPGCITKTHQISIAANVEVANCDHAVVRRQIRRLYGWPEDSLILAFFGFLHPVKGLETLLSAFQRVVKLRPEAKLLLMGGVESLALNAEQAANYWHTLHATISQLGLDSVVQMTGYLEADRVSHQLLAADIGVLPFNHGVTLKSGSLLALMSHSLPVVATRAPIPDPALEDNHLLSLVAPRDVNQLEMALVSLIDDRLQRQQLATNGYQFSRQFAWSTIADAHAHIYRSVCTQSFTTPSQSLA